MVDGLIKYLFDPSASPGEGLISAAPPSILNAGMSLSSICGVGIWWFLDSAFAVFFVELIWSYPGANGYSFRLERRVNARAAHYGLDWPDLNRHPAGM